MTTHHTKEENDGIRMAVAGSAGMVKPAAARLGLPRMTVAAQWNKYLDEATALTNGHKEGQNLANRFLAVALAAQDRLMEVLHNEKSPYRLALISGINLDKNLLLTGRPTSRTEIVKARYVEPGALRAAAARVLDVEARPAALPAGMSQNATNSRPPKSLGKVSSAHRAENVTVTPDAPFVGNGDIPAGEGTTD